MKLEVVRYSAAPGTGKCEWCREVDYTILLVKKFEKVSDETWAMKDQTMTYLCDNCAAKLGVGLLEGASRG